MRVAKPKVDVFFNGEEERQRLKGMNYGDAFSLKKRICNRPELFVGTF